MRSFKLLISVQSLSFLINCFLHQGTLIDTLGMYVLSLSRGLISVCVPIEDLGKIFAVMSALDGLNPIIMSQVYTSIWQVIIVTYEMIYSIYIFSKFLTSSSYLRNFYYQQASKETFTGAYYLVSTIFFALTVFLSTVVYLMIRGKDFVKITAEGAGRITSEQSRNNNAPVNKGKDNIAFIGDMYHYNIAGLSNL